MTRVDFPDFGSSWDDDLTYPVRYFVMERSHLEDRFDSSSLERKRRTLEQAALEFIEAEAMNGFTHNMDGDRRNTGFAGMELEDSSNYGLAEERRVKIHMAAGAVVDAHNELVALAKSRGYDLNALQGEAPKPPWK